MTDDPRTFLEVELRRLRDRIHDDIAPRLKALEMRWDEMSNVARRLEEGIAGIRTEQDLIAKRGEIEDAITEAVRKDRQEHREHWVMRLKAPQKVILYVAALAGALTVIVNAGIQIARFIS